MPDKRGARDRSVDWKGAVAAEMKGPVALLEQLGDEWPIPDSDLERELERAAQKHGWTDFQAWEPQRRGPELLMETNPETGKPFWYVRWQLWCFVDATLRKQRDV